MSLWHCSSPFPTFAVPGDGVITQPASFCHNVPFHHLVASSGFAICHYFSEVRALQDARFVDEDELLESSPAIRNVPVAACGEKGAPKPKKACKNCSCGLKEELGTVFLSNPAF